MKGGVTCLFYWLRQEKRPQSGTMSMPPVPSGGRGAVASHKACSNIPMLLQSLTLLPSTLTFFAVACTGISSTGFGFTILGRGCVPHYDIISMS